MARTDQLQEILRTISRRIKKLIFVQIKNRLRDLLKVGSGFWEYLFKRIHHSPIVTRFLRRIPIVNIALDTIFFMLRVLPRTFDPYMWRRYFPNLRDWLKLMCKGYLDFGERSMGIKIRLYRFGDLTLYTPHEDYTPPKGTFDTLSRKVEAVMFAPFIILNHVSIVSIIRYGKDISNKVNSLVSNPNFQEHIKAIQDYFQ